MIEDLTGITFSSTAGLGGMALFSLARSLSIIKKLKSQMLTQF